jgi:hypothetical protein
MSVGSRVEAGPQIILFIYGLFNDDNNKLNDIRYNVWMMANNELERMWKETFVAYFKGTILAFCLEELGKITKNLRTADLRVDI